MLTLCVPGLLGRAEPFAAMRGARALARDVTSTATEPNGIGTALCIALSLPRATPLAPLCALGADLSVDDRYTIAATPVTLIADRDVVVLAGTVDDLRADEASILIDLLNRHFAGDDMTFDAPRPATWYALCGRNFSFVTSPIDAALRHPIDSFLPSGPDGNLWQRWQVEMQMLLHEHVVNREREQRGLPLVSGIWLSGNGRLTDIALPSLDAVFASGDASGDVARGLARRVGLLANALPPAFSSMLASGNVLAAMAPVSNDADIAHFDADWLQPAVAALESGALDALQLVTDGHGAAVAWRAKRPTGLMRIASRFRNTPLEIPVLEEE